MKNKRNNVFNFWRVCMSNKKKIILSLCIIVFFVLTIMIKLNQELFIDKVVYDFMTKYLIGSNFTNIVKFITNFGGAVVLCILSVVLFLIFIKSFGIYIIANLGLVSICNVILKNIIVRPRPNINRLISESGYSFPSGHMMISTAFYGFLIYLIYKNINNKYLKWFMICFLSILILLIGLSRVYLGVHYITDIMGGLIFSIVYLILFIEFCSKCQKS